MMPVFNQSNQSIKCNESEVGVNDTPVFLLNEYIVELNPTNFNILNQILNWIIFWIESFFGLIQRKNEYPKRIAAS